MATLDGDLRWLSSNYYHLCQIKQFAYSVAAVTALTLNRSHLPATARLQALKDQRSGLILVSVYEATPEEHINDKTRLTNNAGAPVPDNQSVLTAGRRGPMLLQDAWFPAIEISKIRERALMNGEVPPPSVPPPAGEGSPALLPLGEGLGRGLQLWEYQ